MMEMIEKCMRSSDLSGLHALQSMWDNLDTSVFASDRLLKSKKSLLMTASKLGRLECCKFLLSIETPNINTRNPDGFTALHYAAYHGQEMVVFLLLEAGADPKLRNKLQESILDSAIAGNHTKLVDRLKKSRFFKDEFILPGLFDFSAAFLGDLKEKLKNLPTDSASIETADCGVNSIKNRATVDPGSNGNAPHRSSSSSSSSSSSGSSGSFNGKSSTVCTVPGHDDSISDGEIVEDAPAVRRRKEKDLSSSHADDKKKSKERSSKSFRSNDEYEQENDAVSTKAAGLSRYEASKYFITITSVTDGGEEKLAGLTGNLLRILDPGTEVKVHDKNSKIAGNGRVKDDFTIGRSRTNDFNTDDLSVSKSHAVISYFENVGFFLRDLGSKHGTFSAGKRIGITGPGSLEALPVDKEGNVIILSKKPSSSHSERESEGKGFKRSNTGMPLTDGAIVQFGRVVCRVFKKRQSAVISSSFQPSSTGVPQSAAVCGLKRTALMALYGHYEKSEKAVETRAVMKPDVLGRTPLADPVQQGTGVGAGVGATSQGHLSQLREQQVREKEQEKEKQVMAMQVGATLLRKMGWEGLAIGRSGAPAAEPLTAVKRTDREGLGCDTGPAGGAHSASASAQYSSASSNTINSKKAAMRDKMVARFQNAS